MIIILFSNKRQFHFYFIIQYIVIYKKKFIGSNQNVLIFNLVFSNFQKNIYKFYKDFNICIHYCNSFNINSNWYFLILKYTKYLFKISNFNHLSLRNKYYQYSPTIIKINFYLKENIFITFLTFPICFSIFLSQIYSNYRMTIYIILTSHCILCEHIYSSLDEFL